MRSGARQHERDSDRRSSIPITVRCAAGGPGPGRAGGLGVQGTMCPARLGPGLLLTTWCRPWSGLLGGEHSFGSENSGLPDYLYLLFCLLLRKSGTLSSEFGLASLIAGKPEGEGGSRLGPGVQGDLVLASSPLCDCREIAFLFWITVFSAVSSCHSCEFMQWSY